MLDNIIYSANAVLPILLLFFAGYLFKRAGFFTEEFLTVADRLVFNVALPCLLFSQIAIDRNTQSRPEDKGVVLFCVLSTLLVCALSAILLPLLIKRGASRGAFIQGIFRSNLAFLGIPFAKSLFGDEGARLAALLLALLIPLYNALAVLILVLNDPEKGARVSISRRIIKVVGGVAANPLIIATALGFFMRYFDVAVPDMAARGVNYFAALSTPLALLAVGAGLRFTLPCWSVGLALCASVLKTVIIPAICLVTAAFLGFRGAHIGIVFITFGTPTAVSSYIMAKNMNSDHTLAGQIVLFTTLFSMVTIFFGSFLLKAVSLT